MLVCRSLVSVWDFRVVPSVQLGHDGPDPAASQFWYKHASMFKHDSHLYVDAETDTVLPGSTWDMIEQMLHRNDDVRNIQLKALQAPYVELVNAQGAEVYTFDLRIARSVDFHNTFLALNKQLVLHVRTAWKRNLLELQDGYYSKKTHD